MAEVTERFQFIVDMRHEIYVDGKLVEVNTDCYNSLIDDNNGGAIFTINSELKDENADAITEKETAADEIFTAEISEIKESLTKKGVTLNPDANPFDPGERNDDTDDTSGKIVDKDTRDDDGLEYTTDDKGGSDDDSDDKNFTDPGSGGSDIPER